jgi:hypothetical protein
MADFLKKASFYAKYITTRKGANDILGIHIDEKSRLLRRQALEKFTNENPEFVILGDRIDYDGYVQFLNENNTKTCWLIEKHAKVKQKWMDVLQLRESNNLSHYDVEYQFIERNEIPHIKNLIAESESSWAYLQTVHRQAVNVVLAEIWLSNFNSDASSSGLVSQILNKIDEFIKSKLFPFSSLGDFAISKRSLQLLALSEVLRVLGQPSPVKDICWKSVQDYDFPKCENIDRHEFIFWIDAINAKHLTKYWFGFENYDFSEWLRINR